MEPSRTSRITAEGHDTLRRLIEINKDAQAWFHIAAMDSWSEPALLAAYEDVSEQRMQFARELEDALAEVGAKLRPSGTRLLSRGWFDLSHSVSDKTKRLERSMALEEKYRDEYQRAHDMDWPADLRGLLDKHVFGAKESRQRLYPHSGD